MQAGMAATFDSPATFIAAANELVPSAPHRIDPEYMQQWASCSTQLQLHVAAARLEARLRALDRKDFATGTYVREYEETWADALLSDPRFRAWRVRGLQPGGQPQGGYTVFKKPRPVQLEDGAAST
jgi:hypothetical protein